MTDISAIGPKELNNDHYNKRMGLRGVTLIKIEVAAVDSVHFKQVSLHNKSLGSLRAGDEAATHPHRQLLPCGGVTRSTVALSGVSRLMEAPGMDRHTDSRLAVESIYKYVHVRMTVNALTLYTL